jgi:hypothetical protein
LHAAPELLRLSLSPQLYYLLDHGFIDSQTRALFVDSSSYNPALNIFAVVRILFEFTPTGKTHRAHLLKSPPPPEALTQMPRHRAAVLQREASQVESVRYHRYSCGFACCGIRPARLVAFVTLLPVVTPCAGDFVIGGIEIVVLLFNVYAPIPHCSLHAHRHNLLS